MDIIVSKMKDYDIGQLEKQFDFTSNSFQNIGNNILLTFHEIEVLNAYHIPYKKCNSLKEILFQIEEVKADMDIVDEELDLVSSSIAERDYYQNTNK